MHIAALRYQFLIDTFILWLQSTECTAYYILQAPDFPAGQICLEVDQVSKRKGLVWETAKRAEQKSNKHMSVSAFCSYWTGQAGGISVGRFFKSVMWFEWFCLYISIITRCSVENIVAINNCHFLL